MALLKEPSIGIVCVLSIHQLPVIFCEMPNRKRLE